MLISHLDSFNFQPHLLLFCSNKMSNKKFFKPVVLSDDETDSADEDFVFMTKGKQIVSLLT